jgi:hypothetical protein
MSLSASTFLSLALIGVPSYFSPRRRRSSSFATVLLTCSERPDQFCFFHVSGGFTVENSCKPHPVIANNGMGFAATTLMTKHTEDHDSIAEHTEDHDSTAAHTSACVTVKRPLRLFGGAEVVFGVAKPRQSRQFPPALHTRARWHQERRRGDKAGSQQHYATSETHPVTAIGGVHRLCKWCFAPGWAEPCLSLQRKCAKCSWDHIHIGTICHNIGET